MAYLAKDRRKAIVEDYVSRHNGHYDPRGFFDEVVKDPDHEARCWFEWDKEKGWIEANVERARAFVRGFVIPRTEIINHGPVSFMVPLAYSPVDSRSIGGGYKIASQSDRMVMPELCEEAAVALTAWLNRYSGAVKYAGGSIMVIQKVIRLLEKIVEDKAA